MLTKLMQIESSKENSTNFNLVNFEKLEKRIFRKAGTAISDCSMIEEGDRILVAVSGGKDSWVLLYVLNELKKKAPVHFELIAVNIDQGYAGFRQDLIDDFLDSKNTLKNLTCNY